MSLFSEQERQIYHCPHTNRDYDPLGVRRRLAVETRGAFGRLCEEARSPEPAKAAAAQIALTDAARRVFDWKPLEVLDATVWEALIAFTQWLSGKGPRASNLPGTSPSSVGPGSPTTTPGRR